MAWGVRARHTEIADGWIDLPGPAEWWAQYNDDELTQHGFWFDSGRNAAFYEEAFKIAMANPPVRPANFSLIRFTDDDLVTEYDDWFRAQLLHRMLVVD